MVVCGGCLAVRLCAPFTYVRSLAGLGNQQCEQKWGTGAREPRSPCYLQMLGVLAGATSVPNKVGSSPTAPGLSQALSAPSKPSRSAPSFLHRYPHLEPSLCSSETLTPAPASSLHQKGSETRALYCFCLYRIIWGPGPGYKADGGPRASGSASGFIHVFPCGRGFTDHRGLWRAGRAGHDELAEPNCSPVPITG